MQPTIKILGLIDELTQKTTLRELEWREPVKGVFRALVGFSKAVIWKWERAGQGDDSEACTRSMVTLQIRDSSDDEIFSVELGEIDPQFSKLSDLYDMALLHARDVESFIDTLVARLRGGPSAHEVFQGVWQLTYKSKAGNSKGAELFTVDDKGNYNIENGQVFRLVKFGLDKKNNEVRFTKVGIGREKRDGENILHGLDGDTFEGEERMSPSGEVFDVKYQRIANIQISGRPQALDVLIGTWHHRWDAGKGKVNIDRAMNYRFEGDGPRKHYKIENLKYNSGRISFSLKYAETNVDDGNHILEIKGPKLLEGTLNGDPRFFRIYERI